MGRLIRTLPSLCAVVVAAASFALSYVALRDVAARLDAVPPYLAFLVPVVVDGGIIAGSAIIWEASHGARRRQLFPYFFVGVLVAMSVTMNIAHAGPTPLAKVIASLPPLVLLGAIELVAAQHMRAAQQAAPVEPVEVPVPAAAPPMVSPVPVVVPPSAAPAATSVPAPAATPALSPEPAEPPAPAADAGPLRTPGQPVPSPSAVATATAPRPSAEATVVAGSTRRALRTRAQVPDEADGAVEEELRLPTVLIPADLPSAERVKRLFVAHVESGGSPDHPQLANTMAAQLKVTPGYVRKLIRPLREKLGAAPADALAI